MLKIAAVEPAGTGLSVIVQGDNYPEIMNEAACRKLALAEAQKTMSDPRIAKQGVEMLDKDGNLLKTIATMDVVVGMQFRRKIVFTNGQPLTPTV